MAAIPDSYTTQMHSLAKTIMIMDWTQISLSEQTPGKDMVAKMKMNSNREKTITSIPT